MTDTNKSPVTRWDHAIGAGLCMVFLTLLLLTSSDLGLARDEGFYVSTAEQYASWFELLIEDPAYALERASIDRIWQNNHEHPPLIKSIAGLFWLLQRETHVFTNDSYAFRMVGMLSAGLLVWLIFIFGSRAFSRLVGLFAAIAFACMPRVFYHAHLIAFDMPITLMVTWVVYCYWRGLVSVSWQWITGIAFGLALLTKHNSWLLPGILAIHWIWASWRSKHWTKPWWLLAMLTVAPVMFVAFWPWLWFGLWSRVRGYVNFHTQHEYYNMAYLGVNYFWPPFPRSFAWVTTLFTVPLTTLVLSMLGILSEAPQALRLNPDRRHTVVLWLGGLLGPYAPYLLSSTPIFGESKHWMPAYPFMALFAAVGAAWVWDALKAQNSHLQRLRLVWMPATALLLILPAFVQTKHSHPFALTHYTVIAGGPRGGATKGMNRQYWGYTTGSLVDDLKRWLPRGGSVWINDTAWESWRMFYRDGRLPEHIQATSDMASADLVLVHHEPHFNEVDFQAWEAFGSVQPFFVLQYDGVPVVSVYRNPASAAVLRE